ncbi:MAG: chemotaxis protein CheW [Thermodesulfobacteriota bacterium]
MSDLPEQAFREEAQELLTELETALLELEDRPDDMDVVGQIFRAMHTIKGSGAMFGFSDISNFTHEVETVYDLVRNGRIDVSKPLVEISLQARDHIQELLEACCSGAEIEHKKSAQLVEELQKFMPDAKTGAVEAQEDKPEAESTEQRTYRISFKPHSHILQNGTKISSLLNELADLGTCRNIAQLGQIPSLDKIDPEQCYASWNILLTCTCSEDAIRDVFMFVEDDCDLAVQLIEIGEGGEEERQRLGDILIGRGEVTQEDIDRILAKSKRIGEMLVDAGLVDQDQIEAALQEQKVIRAAQEQRQRKQPEKAPATSSLRVPAERLDELVNLVGELVTVQSRLSQVAAQRHDADLDSIAEEVERLTEELRDSTLNIRMLPIGSTFSKFKRLVRDIASNLNKEVEFETAGAETELDKTVIEQLNDPLIHIIRNSMDHGIEMPAEREAQGKPRHGTVFLSAEHAGDSVIIEIRDDGKGLDAEKLRLKAIDKGVISEDDTLSEQECYQLIFAAGFSTAEQVSGLSGRGVGMDVVKRAIEALRGSIELTSTPGQGTTVRMQIPLTLAIIESLLVTIDGGSFILPLTAVEECIELTKEDIEAAHGRHLAKVRGSLIPYIPLRKTFGITTEAPPIQQIVITQTSGKRLGFVVDNVIGEHQTVIKPLGPLYKDLRTISGGTILGDGSIALILDLLQLMHQADTQEKKLESDYE